MPYDSTTPKTESTNSTTESVNSTTESSMSTTESSISTTESANSTTESANQSTIADPRVPDCNTEDPQRYLLSDPTDCNKFYSCSNGVPVSMQCPDGLHFNQELMVCDWPENAGCNTTQNDNQETTTELYTSPTTESASPTTESVNATDSPNPTTDSANTTVSANTTESANTTPTTVTESTTPTDTPVPDCSTEDSRRYLSDPTDCNKFYSCSNGVPLSMQCPDGLHFNQELMICDWPEHAGCNTTKNNNQESTTEFYTSLTTESAKPTTEFGNTTVSGNTTGTANTTESASTTTTTVTESTTPTDTQVPDCNVDPQRYLLSDPTECNKFYSCSNGVPVSMQCPDGLHFNQELMVCDWPEHAGCNTTQNNNQESTTELYTSPTTESANPTTELGNTTVSANPTTESANTTGTDNTTGSANTTESVSTTPTTVTEFTTPTDTQVPDCNEDPQRYLLSDPTDCNKFYSCSNGLPVSMECPDGLHFNPQLMVCDWPESANCSVSTTEITTNEMTTTKITGILN